MTRLSIMLRNLLVLAFACFGNVHAAFTSSQRNEKPAAGLNRNNMAVSTATTSSNGATNLLSNLFANKNNNKSKKETQAVQALLDRARALGPVGAFCSPEDQESLLAQARALAPQSPAQPARAPLQGVHDLVYSAAPGGSSGKLGPVAGTVQQEFVNDDIFINSVQLGPLRIALTAQREIKNGKCIQVSFQETTVSFLGLPLTTKDISGGGGVWKYLYCGEHVDALDGKRKLIRVMETPSLFVLEQVLE